MGQEKADIEPKYRGRIIDEEVAEFLQTFGAVVIEGPKWCGKTWTAISHSASAVMLADSRGNFQYRTMAQTDPSLVLAGATPRLIDEWQEVPPLWDAVRFAVDERQAKGQFILTGSATPQHKGILHSGAGRIGRLRMRPMSLFESGDSSGAVSLRDICEENFVNVATGQVRLEQLVDLVIRGGWPQSLDMPIERAAKLPLAYMQAVVEDDVYRIDDVQRSREKMWQLLRSLARNESTTVTNNTLRKDIQEVDRADIDANTIAAYLDVFQRLFLLDNQPPFAANIRSKVRVKQAPKRHFVDPSLAAALLKASQSRLLADLRTFGFLFEALVERDLRIYAQSFAGQLFHYQDYAGKEIDAVIEMPDGSWAAIEIKLGAHQIDEAAASLISIRNAIAREEKGIPPKVLCVVCGLSAGAYLRPDGVYVVPLTALKQ